MAFLNKIGNLLKQTGSRNVTSKFSASNTSLFQAIRSMSTSSKLFVGGLSYNTDEMSLREAFSQYGEVVEARVILDRETGRSRGFGFVTFTSSEAASSAIEAFDGKDLHGRRVRVNHATEKPRGGGFGAGGGGGFGYGGQGGYYQGGGYQGGGGYGGGNNYPSGGGGGYGGGNNYPSGGGGGYSGGNNYPSSGGGGNGGGNNYASGGGVDDFSTGHGAGDSGYGNQTGFAGKEGQEDDYPGAGISEFGSDDNSRDENDESKDYANTRN